MNKIIDLLCICIAWIGDAYDYITDLIRFSPLSPHEEFVRELIKQTKELKIQWSEKKEFGSFLEEGFDDYYSCVYQGKEIQVHCIGIGVQGILAHYSVYIDITTEGIVLRSASEQDVGNLKYKHVPERRLEKLWLAVQMYHIMYPLEEMKKQNKKYEEERNAWLAENSEEAKNARAAKSKARHDAKMAKIRRTK